MAAAAAGSTATLLVLLAAGASTSVVNKVKTFIYQEVKSFNNDQFFVSEK
tara:strand:- start:300 stop:449 length:150 start_codon:yes stop_codon:yes gene_type:complete